MNDTPYFVQMRGCINCSASKLHKERHGTAYGFDHELIAKCVLVGCFAYGHTLGSPFLDPAEIIRMANASGRPDFRQRARHLCAQIGERFGEHYRSAGAPVDEMLKQLQE